jgi:formate/nitrite transporter FocA (FNT family)
MTKYTLDTKEGCAFVAVVLVVFAALWLGVAAVFMLVWNAVVPDVFGGPSLTYWQAVLVALLGNFIGGFFRSSGSSK